MAVSAAHGDAAIVGTDGPDQLTGTGQDDMISGLGGNDIIKGVGGDDLIIGGAGDDKLYGGDGNDTIYDDSNIFGQSDVPDNDLLDGGAGDDFLVKTEDPTLQNDVDDLKGDDGNDTLVFNGFQTGDKAEGGAGTDLLEVLTDVANTASISLTWNASNFQVLLNGVATIFATDIERLYVQTGAGSDTLVGSNLGDQLYSAGGADKIDGGDGDDLVSEGYYRSAHELASGFNLDGGNGTDIFAFTDQYAARDYTFDLKAGIFTEAGQTLGSIKHFERLDVYINAGDNHLTGGDLDDILTTGDGNDVLNGGDGNDQLGGGEGTNTLSGGNGNDVLYGGSGANTIDGGAGDDVIGAGAFGTTAEHLTGGAGDDYITGGGGADVMDGGSGNDTYVVTAGDQISDSSGIDTIVTALATFDMTQYGSIENLSYIGDFTGVITGNALDNLIVASGEFSSLNANGGDGNDHIVGGGYSDSLSGGDGNDHLEGLKFADILNGDGGKDVLAGGDGNDALDGGDGNDNLNGGDQDDVVHGGTGDDIIAGDPAPIDPGVTFGSGHLTKPFDTAETQATALSLDGKYSLAADPNIIDPTVLPHVSVKATLNDTAADFYSLNIAHAGEKVIVDVDTLGMPHPFESSVNILAADGTILDGNEFNIGTGGLGGGGSTGDNDAYLEFTAPSAGTYTIEIYSNFPGAAGSNTYTLNVSLGSLAGNDVLFGDAGNDMLSGGRGDDVLDGGADDDTLDGGDGSDTASYASATAGVTVAIKSGAQNTGGAGTDTLVSIENLTGSAFNDHLTGDKGDNVLSGGLGNDVLDGGGGNDTVSFADAVSAITVELAKSGAQSTGAGSDTLISIENVLGSSYGDNLTGSGGDDKLSGGDGDDLLSGGAGNDVLDGGAGIDTASYATATAGVTVDLMVTAPQATGAGTDTLTSIENLLGGAGGDTLSGDAGDNVLSGGAGNDVLAGRDGNDLLNGGAGNDRLDGGIGIDTVTYADASAGVTADLSSSAAQNTGGSGKDTLSAIENAIGSAFDDVLTGADGANSLTGGAGDDLLSGAGGNDLLDGGAGNDKLDGGGGFDIVSYAGATAAVIVDLAKTAAQNTGGSGHDTLVGIEEVIGSAFADKLSAANAGSTLIGGDGNDQLVGRDGSDILQGGLGNDTITGGGGEDLVSYADAPGVMIDPYDTVGVTVDLSLTGAQDTVADGKDKLSGIEDVLGSAFADTITGNAQANHLDGGGGNDKLDGGDGNDLIEGGFVPPPVGATQDYDSDQIDGGAGTDTVTYHAATSAVTIDLLGFGGNGYETGGGGYDTLVNVENAIGSAYGDTISGTAGNNVLTGGAGDDMLDGRDGNDTLDGGGGNDTATYGDAAAAVTVDLSNAHAQDPVGAGIDKLISVENLIGSAFDDTLTGTSGANLLVGGAGNDTLHGGSGNDVIRGGLGDDVFDGGSGADTADFSDSGGATVDLAVAGPQNTGNGMDSFVSIENLSGSAGSDHLSGDDADNILNGVVGGNDMLEGRGGDDVLPIGYGSATVDGGDGTDVISFADIQPSLYSAGPVQIDLSITTTQYYLYTHTNGPSVVLTSIEGATGSGFDDVLFGSDADNRLDGGDGNDTLVGRAGADTMTGGLGADIFYFEAGSAKDQITDFAPGADKIRINVAGVTSFSNLTIKDDGHGGTDVSWKGGALVDLKNVKPAALHAADFSFGALFSPVPSHSAGSSSFSSPFHEARFEFLHPAHGVLA